MGLISIIRRRQIKAIVRRFGKVPKQVLLVVLLSFLSCYLYQSPLGVVSNVQQVRLYFALRGPIPPPEDVIIVAIDDRSYSELDAPTTYPLPRRHLAAASEAIADAGPRVFVADLKFPDDRVYEAASDERIVNAFARAPTTIWTGREDDKPGTKPLPSGEHFRRAAKMELDMFIEGAQGYLFGAGNSRSWQLGLSSKEPVTPD